LYQLKGPNDVDLIPLTKRITPVGWLFFGLAILFLSAGIALTGDKQADSKDAKIDSKLNKAPPAARFPVFVRMTDQLIGKAGDFEKFCQEHQKQKRSEVRPFVLKTLRQKSDQSWKKMAKEVDKLVKDGQIQNIERFWIVNGFSCDATAEASKQLAASEHVSFVYRRIDGLLGNTRTGQAQAPATEKQKKMYEQILKDWKDDSDEPFSTEGLEIPWNLQLIQANAAWEQEKTTGKGVVVAVCDTGLMPAPALVRALWKNSKEQLDGKDNDGNGYADDLFGYDFLANSLYVLEDSPQGMSHGSVCAGIIAGRPLNSKKLVTGVAPRARVMVLRGSIGDLKVYEYALANGADVLSMSQSIVGVKLDHLRGVFRTSQEHLVAGGVVSSGGAGNWSHLPKGQQILSTKDIPCVIATAGILKDGSHPKASSEGPCYWQDVKFYDDYPKSRPLLKPDVTAPFGGYPLWSRQKGGGGEIVSKEGDEFALVTGPGGNSFSAPHTAGVAALMLSANPELNAWEVKELIEQTCKDIGPKGRDITFGAGLLQALDAVRAAKKVKK
jgi:subtilisin family serine protease